MNFPPGKQFIAKVWIGLHSGYSTSKFSCLGAAHFCSSSADPDFRADERAGTVGLTELSAYIADHFSVIKKDKVPSYLVVREVSLRKMKGKEVLERVFTVVGGVFFFFILTNFITF